MKKTFDSNKLGTIANYFEVAIAIIILVIAAIRAIEIISGIFGLSLVILQVGFEQILSMMLALVIGIEFTKMLFKHTPESVLDVLLFAIARQVIMYHEGTMDLLFGIVAIAGLFAIKRYLSDKKAKTQEKIEE